jgi:hypothetical protein
MKFDNGEVFGVCISLSLGVNAIDFASGAASMNF